MGVYGKYVTSVLRGQEMMDTMMIPMIIAPLNLYTMRRAETKPPQKIPSHMVGERIFVAFGQSPFTMSAAEHPPRASGVLLPVIVSAHVLRVETWEKYV